MRRLVGVVDSMTPEERRNPKKTIDQSRRRRIAAGAGVEPHEVNELVKQFEGMADLMRRVSNMGIRDRMRTMQEMAKGSMANPGGLLTKQKVGTGKRLTPKEKANLKKQREKDKRRQRRNAKNDGKDSP
jgi:signal recognition particle subunit SRP54